MDKRLTILTLAFFVFAPVMSGLGAEELRGNLLWDGFVLTGVEGKLFPAVLRVKSEKANDSNCLFNGETPKRMPILPLTER